MSNYVPNETLPIYPAYATVIKKGVKYKAYYETDWHQVMTEDGVPLCELLQSMPSFSTNNFYKYCGTLKSDPEITAIDKLYAITNQENGDVYLIQTDMASSTGYVCEAYVWLGNTGGWVYCGTTDRKVSMQRDLPNVINLMPTELGEPGQVMVIGKDGKSIVWGDSFGESHNEDPEAHPDIREEIDLKADKLIIFNDTLNSDNWTYNGESKAFEYIYQSDKLPTNSYFEITPVINTAEDTKVVTTAAINAIYKIKFSPDGKPYTILKAKRVPKVDIDICIKAFGSFIEK